MSSPTLIFLAPVSGEITPLSAVPDQAFANGLIGDGLAVMPESDLLLAPSRGTISSLHEAGHALTLLTPQGFSLLLHVGIDTVLLKGDGFSPLVAEGDAVEAGQPLLRFDPLYIADQGKSPLVLMLVLNTDRAYSLWPATGRVQAGHSPALMLSPASPTLSAPAAGVEVFHSTPLVFRQAEGLHARPAARLAAEARRYPAAVTLACGDKSANAKSVASLMALGVKQGDEVTLSARGEQAAEAAAALVALLEKEPDAPEPQPAPGPQSGPQPGPDPQPGMKALPPDAPEPEKPGEGIPVSSDLLPGLPAAPGMVTGFARQWRPGAPELPERGDGKETEERRLRAALDEAGKELEDLAEAMAGQDAERAAVITAQRALLGDPELLDEALDSLSRGQSAAFAWREACDGQAAMLAAVPDPLIAARAEDVRDIGRRVIRRLTGGEEQAPNLPEHTILIAEEMPASVVASLDPAVTPGFCTVKGNALSHASLLARTAGIVSVTGLDERALSIADGAPLLLDGTNGRLHLNPDATALELARLARKKAEEEAKRMLREALAPARTRDGKRVFVTANIGGLEDTESALAKGADGVGLFRTEFLFLEREEAPPEEKQAAAYARIAKRLGREQPLVLRTLDAGGDKPLPFLGLQDQDSSFLGPRGYRLCREYPGLFAAQIRAALKAASYCRLSLLLPMIASVEELREARSVLEHEKKALGLTRPTPLGIMVEVPSAALLAENLAAETDFFSIGTNDLTQYTLATGRGSAQPAGAADALHPAVLRLIAMTVRGAKLFGKPVSICGDIAADPEAVPLLLGLGLTSLSVPPAAIPAVKAAVRGSDLARCEILAADALTMLNAAEVRNYLKNFRM